jgi:hypothetical protein
MGFRFVLLLEALDLTKYPFLSGAKFRPGRIQISYPTSTSWVTLSWEDKKAHELLTVQWLHQKGATVHDLDPGNKGTLE